MDTLATVAAAVGAQLPPPQTGAEDSFNMLPAWLGQKPESPLRPDMIVHGADGNFAIRRGAWKWIEGMLPPDAKVVRARAEQFRSQLYNLAQDIGETRDLAADHADVPGSLKTLLNQHRARGFTSKRQGHRE